MAEQPEPGESALGQGPATAPPPAGDFQSEIRHSDSKGHERPQAAGGAAQKVEEESARAEPPQGVPEQGEQRAAAAAMQSPDAGNGTRSAAATGGELFPSSPLIERQKSFWIKIFTQYPSDQGLIHDKGYTLSVYEEVNLDGRSRRAQKRYLKRRKRAVARRLRALAKAVEQEEPLDEEARSLLARLPPGLSPKEIRKLAGGIRFQRGLADRFRDGLVRSGAVLAEMRTILARSGVPEDLVYLPHVESSFNLRTHSKFGAAGIWQFTRGTGRKFLTIKYEVDERLDPIRSTEAAARFLRQNHDRLGSWPLAITAYNHGPQGIERIIKRRGTRDLSDLIEVCGCRLFKFASKNFYAEFLAARQVATRREEFFGFLQLEPTLIYKEVGMPFFLEFAKALQILGLDEAHLRKLNPSLRTPVLVGAKLIPKGYQLRLPAESDPEEFLAMVPHEHRRKKQKLTEVVRVRRGDTLYDLGRRYRVPWQVIARANHITAYHRIRPGQRLVIPRRGKVGRRLIAKAEVKPPRRPPRQVAARSPRAPVNGKVPPTARVEGTSIAFQRAEGAYLFQDLDVQQYDPETRIGAIIPAYGETLGHYAEWSGVTARTVRRYNPSLNGSLLIPGRRVVMPLKRVSVEQFSQSRIEYHQSREEDFFTTYAVAEVTKVKVRRGDSVWNISQSNDVPMWLFYQQNPRLVNASVRAGMSVNLPVIEELADLEQANPDQDTGSEQ